MLKRIYVVCLLVSAMGMAAAGQTAAPGKCRRPQPAEPASDALTPLMPIPLLPEVVSSSLSILAPIMEPTLPQKDSDKAEGRAEDPFAPFVFSFGPAGYLGVYLEEVTPERVKELGLTEERGAIIMKVVEGGPAQKAGLKENDVIVSFNGRPVDSVRELQRLMSETPAGRSVSIEVVRGGARQTFSATMGKRFSYLHEDFGAAARTAQEEARRQVEELAKKWPKGQVFGNFSFVFPSLGKTRLGVAVESLTDQLAEFFGAKGGGVLVTQVYEDTPASRAGLKAGDVITSAGGEKVNDVSALVHALSQKEEGPLSLTVVRDRREKTVTVTLEKSSLPRTRVRPGPVRVVKPSRVRLL